jgi:hypothetical protein
VNFLVSSLKHGALDASKLYFNTYYKLLAEIVYETMTKMITSSWKSKLYEFRRKKAYLVK